MLYKVVLTFESVDEILQCDQSKECIELYFPLVPFIMMVKVVLTFESVDEILRCDVFKDMKAIERCFPKLCVQWNLDLTKCQGTGVICSLYRGFAISKTSL